jgi:hypothetical protein
MSALKPGLEGSPRASPAVLSMLTLKKYFSHPNFSYLLFSTAICKTETGTANSLESKLSSQSKHGAINKYDDCIY